MDIGYGEPKLYLKLPPTTTSMSWKSLPTVDCLDHCFKYRPIFLNIGRYAEIPVFYSKRYGKCKNLSDIILDRYGPIFRHVADISVDIRDEISDISADIVTYLNNYYFFYLIDHFI